MKLEDKIRALLEAKNAEAVAEAAQPAPDDKEEEDKEQADRVDGEPAVKIENPMDPNLSSSETGESPESEIANAEAQGQLSEGHRATSNAAWNEFGHKKLADDSLEGTDEHGNSNAFSVQLKTPIAYSGAKIHNSEFEPGMPVYKAFRRHQDYLEDGRTGFSKKDITIPSGQHVVLYTGADGASITGHHPAHGYFRVRIDGDEVESYRTSDYVKHDPNSNIPKYNQMDEDEEAKQKAVDEATHGVTESISDLLGDEFSDEFKLKAQTIFEAAVKDQVTQIQAKLQEEHNAAVAKLNEEFEEKFVARSKQLEEETSDKIDGYLNFLAEEWKQDNKIALEASIKTELTESFVNGIKAVFEQHYVDLPEEKADLYGKALQEKADLEAALATTVGSLARLTEEVNAFKREQIITEAVKDFASLDVARFKTLTEDLAFEDAETFKTKVGIVKQSFFSQKTSAAKEQLTEELVNAPEIVETGSNVETVVEDTSMARYVRALGKK